jgi:hypothetical protein
MFNTFFNSTWQVLALKIVTREGIRFRKPKKLHVPSPRPIFFINTALQSQKFKKTALDNKNSKMALKLKMAAKNLMSPESETELPKIATWGKS